MSNKELADFNPATGHLFTCNKEWESGFACDKDCANHLYAIASHLDRENNSSHAICGVFNHRNTCCAYHVTHALPHRGCVLG